MHRTLLQERQGLKRERNSSDPWKVRGMLEGPDGRSEARERQEPGGGSRLGRVSALHPGPPRVLGHRGGPTAHLILDRELGTDFPS